MEWTIHDLHEVAFTCIDALGTTTSVTDVYTANLTNRTLEPTVLTSTLTFNTSQVMNGTRIKCEDGFDGDEDTCTLYLLGIFVANYLS